MQSNRVLAGLPVPISASPLSLPMLGPITETGRPCPATALTSTHLDLAKALVQHPFRTFIQRATGDSMEGAGIFDGDLLVVDRCLAPQHGDLVVAHVNGEFICKRYRDSDGLFALESENPAYANTSYQNSQEVEIWGVVTNSVRRFRQA